MQQKRQVIISKDLGEFFRQEVTEARSDLGVKLTELTEYYLVRLLCDFSRRDSSPTPGQEHLALLYKRALEASLAERAQLLKTLGDLALYVSGFFAESLERSLVDLDYYISMGGNAYSNLSSIVAAQRNGQTFAELYYQLARNFTELVDVLNQIADRSRENAASDTDLIRLYDRWARTGSERVRKLLLERGLLPGEGVPTEYVQ